MKFSRAVAILAAASLAFSGLVSAAPASAAPGCANPLQMTFDTTKGTKTVTMPLANIIGTVDVAWGDGSTNAYTIGGNQNHTYSADGTYQVSVCGTVSTLGNTGFAVPNIAALVSVDAWGDGGITSLNNAFNGATNLTSVPNNLPSTVQILSNTFKGATSFNDPDISSWDTTNVTTLYSTFSGATSFNQNLGSWNTANVTDLAATFFGATAFNNGGSGAIGNWNTGKVTRLAQTFQGCPNFDQNIGAWDVSKVTTMQGAFSGATAFNNGGSDSIKNWNTSANTSMEATFYEARNFNQEVGLWDTSNVTTLANTFYNAWVFNNAGKDSINNWNTAKVTRMDSTFFGAKVFNQPLGSWNTGASTTFYQMFYGARLFNQPLDNWNTSNSTNFAYMFANATPLDQNFGAWDVSKATRMDYMFFGCGVFNNKGSDSIKNWDTSNVTTMESMFVSAKLFNQPIQSWNTSKVINMLMMFNNAQSFNQPIGSWDVSKVQSMYGMFYSNEIFGAHLAFKQDISTWDLSSLQPSGFAGKPSGYQMFWYDGLTTENYDKFLIAMDKLTLVQNNQLGMGASKYTCAARAAHDSLTAKRIFLTDAGMIPLEMSITSITPGNGSLEVNWTAPTCAATGVVYATSYQYSIDGGTTWVDFAPEATTALKGTIPELTNGTAYPVLVRAMNGASVESRSLPLTGTPYAENITIKAVAKTVTEGDSVPTFTFVVTNAAGQEVNVNTLTGWVAPTCTSTYSTTSLVSDSPMVITCSGASVTGYGIAYETANLTINAKVTSGSKTLKVYFGADSPALSKATKDALKKLAQQVKTLGVTVKTVTVNGWVKPVKSIVDAKKLSTQRAQNVASLLKSLGIKATFKVAGKGKASAVSNKSRFVEVKIAW